MSETMTEFTKSCIWSLFELYSPLFDS